MTAKTADERAWAKAEERAASRRLALSASELGRVSIAAIRLCVGRHGRAATIAQQMKVSKEVVGDLAPSWRGHQRRVALTAVCVYQRTFAPPAGWKFVEHVEFPLMRGLGTLSWTTPDGAHHVDVIEPSRYRVAADVARCADQVEAKLAAEETALYESLRVCVLADPDLSVRVNQAGRVPWRLIPNAVPVAPPRTFSHTGTQSAIERALRAGIAWPGLLEPGIDDSEEPHP